MERANKEHILKSSTIRKQKQYQHIQTIAKLAIKSILRGNEWNTKTVSEKAEYH